MLAGHCLVSFLFVLFYCLELRQEKMVRFRASKTGLRPPPLIVFLLTVQRRVSCCNSSLLRLWFRIWRLCCPYLLRISLSLVPREGHQRRRDTSKNMLKNVVFFFVAVAYFGYLYLFFFYIYI